MTKLLHIAKPEILTTLINADSILNQSTLGNNSRLFNVQDFSLTNNKARPPLVSQENTK
jgi:hypothetical protein